MKQQTIFIADLHLSVNTPVLNDLFFDFLDKLEADALYILGDLFEYWIGDDDQSEFHRQMVTALKNVAEKMPVYFMPGNRDFLVSEQWLQFCGVHLLKDPTCVTLYGHRILLSHGDRFCTKDRIHQWFRLFTQNLFFQKLFLAMPYCFRKKLAETIREKSTIRNELAKKFSPIMGVQSIPVKQWLTKTNAHYFIHGHTHKAGIQRYENELRAVLPPWKNSTGGYLAVFLNQKHDIQFELCNLAT